MPMQKGNFWRGKGYLTCAKLDGAWCFVGETRQDLNLMYRYMEARKIVPVRAKNTPRTVAEIFKQHGSTAVALKDHLPPFTQVIALKAARVGSAHV